VKFALIAVKRAGLDRDGPSNASTEVDRRQTSISLPGGRGSSAMPNRSGLRFVHRPRSPSGCHRRSECRWRRVDEATADAVCNTERLVCADGRCPADDSHAVDRPFPLSRRSSAACRPAARSLPSRPPIHRRPTSGCFEPSHPNSAYVGSPLPSVYMTYFQRGKT